MQMIIDTANTSLHVKNKCFYISNKNIKRQISPKRVNSIAVLTNCNINTSAIRLAALHEIPIIIFDNNGSVHARLWSPYFINLSQLRKKQLLFSMDLAATSFVTKLILKKSDNQIKLLQKLGQNSSKTNLDLELIISKIKDLSKKIAELKEASLSQIRNTIMAYEGNINKQYLRGINLSLPKDFKFKRRSRRPAEDSFNASLNFIYGLTYSVVESGIMAKGLDPSIGMLHVDMHHKPTLAFDLIEPIRPLMDELLVELINQKELIPNHFYKNKDGFRLSKSGKRLLITRFNNALQQRRKLNGKIIRLKDHIYLLSTDLATLITKSIEL